MTDKMDLALDDIISSNKGGREGRGGRGGRGGSRGGRDNREHRGRDQDSYGPSRSGGRRGGSGPTNFLITVPNPRSSRGGGRFSPYGKGNNNRQQSDIERTRPGSLDEDTEWKHDLYVDDGKPARRQNNRKAEQTPTTEGSTRIRAENLSFDLLEKEIKELFSSVGNVVNVKLHYDRAGRSEGSAMITFSTVDEADEAIEKMNGQNGMELSLASAAREKNSNRGGRISRDNIPSGIEEKNFKGRGKRVGGMAADQED
ncbi:putative RNA binding protein [Planoprotostelium fungivorum]|uniref:Putative RNA binding protein n=1 Tax=Planoprotostelium fungivorum TaxID=1890364 RepID=A0A2P6NPI9_9EUKA|nr:putative RNA binding protein [Planoprotostelium fungivorum]